MARASKSIEPKQTLINQGLQTNDSETIQIGSLKPLEPQILDKKQGVTQFYATPLQIGDALLAVYELIFVFYANNKMSIYLLIIM